MTLSQFIEELFQYDVELWINDGQLHYHDPLGRLTPELTSSFGQYKATLLSILRQPGDKSITFYPLSSAQQTLWYLYQVAPNSSAYNIKFSARIWSAIDVGAFQKAFQALVDRHSSLRTSYTTLGEIPVQLVHECQQVPLDRIDASTWSEEDVRKRMLEEADRPFDLERGPLCRLFLFSRSSEEHILWLLIHHIAVDVCSFETLIEELGELYASERRGGPTTLAPLELQYKDYVRWETQMLAGQEGERHWAYLQKKLSGELPVLNLSTDRPRPPIQTYNTDSYSIPLPAKLILQLKTMAQFEGVSFYTTLVSVFFVLLYRYTSQEDILLGASTFEKICTKFKGVAGYFVNEIPLRADLSENPSFREFLHKTHKTIEVAFEHRAYPSHLLAKRLHISRDLSRPPLFQTIFTLQELHQKRDIAPFLLGQAGGKIEIGGFEMESIRLEEKVMIFVDLQLTIVEEYGAFSALWQYNTDLFDAVTIERMADHFQVLLGSIVAGPEQYISDIPILTDAEQHQILVAWNDTHVDYPLDRCLHELIELQVERTPDAIAATFEKQRLTYRKLNAKANQLAHHLQRLGVGPEVLVGICVERSLEMIVGLLGILKAGGAYVPLDPEYPRERLSFMFEDSQVSVLLTQKKLLTGLPEHNAVVFCLDTDWGTIAQERQDNPKSNTSPENLIYTIYTSGSTGRPKGSRNVHRALCNRLLWMQDAYQLTEKDRILQKTPFSFDVSGWEFWWPLLTGSRLVFAKPGGHKDSAYLVKLIAEQQISTLHFVPSMLQVFLEEKNVGICTSLRRVICSGEALPFDLQERFLDRLHAELHNLYGPTEAAIDVTFWACTREKYQGIVPIGRPIANTQIYILDTRLNPVPVGVPGELHIGGVNLARDYLNRPELTAEKFIQNPFSDDSKSRLYKTGDLTRFLSDGNIEYLGRLDHQVKIRGFRIELGEIEAILTSHSEVRETVVVTLEDAHGNKRLAAYIVPTLVPDRVPYQCNCLIDFERDMLKVRTEDISFDGVSLVGVPLTFCKAQHIRLQLRLPGDSQVRWLKGEVTWCHGKQAGIHFLLSPDEQVLVRQSVEYVLESQGFLRFLKRTVSANLRNYLKQKLPDYMIPSSLVFRNSFPLTPSGKVDRRALPAPERISPDLEGDFVAPRSPIEKMLAKIWADLLDVERIGIHDDFFELGGNSLIVTRLASRLRDNFQVELSISKLFETPTIAELTAVIGKSLIATETQTIPRRGATSIPAPLSFAQQRLWFLEQLDVGTPTYNLPFSVRLTGLLDITILEQSINEIVRRHETLRTTFAMANGQAVTVIAPTLNLALPVKDLRSLSENERKIAAQKAALSQAQQYFDLTQSPLFRVLLLRLDEEESILLITFHHTIFDGWSIDLFLKEVAAFYEAFSSGRPSPLPELPIQYSDFAQWQREWLQGKVLERQSRYWKQQLSGRLPVLELPTDYPRPAKRSFRGKVQSFVLSRTLSEAIQKLSQQEKSTPFMTLLAAFKTLLYRYSGQEDIIVGSPVANRNRTEIEKLIGFFVNTLVLRTDISGNPTFCELLGRIRELVSEAHAYQDVPFERLVEELQPERELNRQPIFQVMFAFQDAPIHTLKFSNLILEPVETHNGASMFDLTLDMLDTEQGFTGFFEYNTDLFDSATILRMIGHFQTLLEGIVADHDRKVSELPILTRFEQQKILVEWNSTAADYPKGACIHALFEFQVERTPNAIATVFGEDQMTYRELNRRANQLAHYLQKLGVGPEVLVCICVDRSLEMLVGILGILKAGAAYVPMDPTNPTKRLVFMLEDTEASVLVTQQHLQKNFPDHNGHTVCLDSDWQDVLEENDENPQYNVSAENLAYVIYTSGSTGIPKGVLISHRALVNRCVAIMEHYALEPHDRVLQFASISFDVSLEEIFPSLLSGATIILRLAQVPLSFEAFSTFVKKEKLTILNLPTTYWHEWVSELSRSNSQPPPSLRLVVVGTEQASAKHLAIWKGLVHDRVRWINAYGPTEATITTTIYEACQEDRYANTVPIGRPLNNTRLYLLDRFLRPVPIGIPGELYISSVSLARGYLRRPELTDETFIPDPFDDEPGARLYKTGDLARYLPDGNIEFLGRVDHQVKIRGFRVELGEIETSLTAHPAIHEAVVVVREDVSGNKRLAAYIISDREEKLSISGLRDFLKKQLPDYMVPAIFTFLEAFPLTSSGKIDRHNLPDPDFDRSEFTTTFVAPRNPTEELLADIWAEILGFEKIGIHDNFFDLGGHSLLSMQLMSKIAAVMNLNASVKLLFLHPTIARLTTALRKLRRRSEIIQLSPTEASPDVGQALSCKGNRRRQAPSLFKVEPEPLVNTAPFEAIALDYFLSAVLTETGLSRDKIVYDWCNNRPVLYNVAETDWGRIGVLMLPLFDFELYHNKEALLGHIVDALEISRQLGASMVSLTGLLPSATNYGLDIADAIADRKDLPMITTGHDTTCATVVLTVREILQQSRRDLTQEHVGFLGLGSIGVSSLRLILRTLPHPAEIVLCDVHAKLHVLGKIRQELIDDFGFQGKVHLAAAQTEIPPKIYEATLIVGATNVPDILDIDKVKPGTMIVDDSGPHCFSPELAISRFQEQGDILFTEGGVLRSPQPITDRVYLPPSIKKDVNPEQIMHWFSLKGSPFDVTSCVFSSLLSARFEGLAPTVGEVDSKAASQHYAILDLLGFRGADLHCEDYVISEDSIRNFRSRFGKA